MVLPMPEITAVQRFLHLFTIAAYAVLLLKIYLEPALHRYRYFAIYLAAQTVRGLLGLFIPMHTTVYGWFFILGSPVIWICYVLVVKELYSLVLTGYQGIATFGRYALAVGLGISVLLSSLTLIYDLSGKFERFPILLSVFAAERGVVSSLLILLIFLMAFLLWFPVPLSRNLVVYAAVFFIYFLSKALALFFRNMIGPTVIAYMNLAVLTTVCICLIVWIVMLNAKGEQRAVQRKWDEDSQDRLLRQLDSINASLVRSKPKNPR